jgi:hypothetical protein
MESQILTELTYIRWLLAGLFILGFIFFIYSTALFIGNWVMRRSTIDLGLRDIKIAEAQMYESKGQLPEFLKTSTELVELYPGDILANWYFAMSSYKNNHLGTALSALGHVKQIDAAWCKETVDEYVDAIKSEMKGPKSV